MSLLIHSVYIWEVGMKLMERVRTYSEQNFFVCSLDPMTMRVVFTQIKTISHPFI